MAWSANEPDKGAGASSTAQGQNPSFASSASNVGPGPRSGPQRAPGEELHDQGVGVHR